jgi:FkbM family methyltransferase
MKAMSMINNLLSRWNEHREWERIKKVPRYIPTSTVFQGRSVKIVDACTYRAGVKEIFGKNIYNFKAEREDPFIVDCGANIGLSVIYFKKMYPSARIVAFEPDPQIFSALQANVDSFGLDSIKLYQCAVWKENGEMPFKQEGGFSGRINAGAENTIQVSTIRLRDYLYEEIDFLKLDIEGAELQVVKDCEDCLGSVARMFIEYHSECDQPQRLDELLAIIRNAGFRYQIHEAYVASTPFLCQPQMAGMDLQLNIFCFRPAIR